MSAKTRVFNISLLLVIFGFAGWFFLSRSSTNGKIRNVLLISIDTCRADYLSCYGYSRKTTPNIDAVAHDGVLFENVASSVPLTLPSHSSMLTGTIPPYHGVHDNFDYRLGQSALTLAEILKDKGFTTGAIVSSFSLDSQFGTDQGFDYYNDQFEENITTGAVSERRGGEASKFACKWLSEHKREPFFLFLHYYDPHSIYEPPEPFKSSYADNLYAGEIAYTDRCIKQVLKKLQKLNLYNSTLIIITSDHGEALGEHKEMEHGYFIYDCSIKVPMIFKYPKCPKGLRVTDIVGLIDIVPTTLTFLGITVPSQIQGNDLSGHLKGKNPLEEERFLYCESLLATMYNCNPLLGVVTNRWKYIQTTQPELYDLKNDPHEMNNLIDEQPQRGRIMKDYLKRILEAQTNIDDSNDSKLTLDQESRARLESLGYVSSGTIDDSFEFDQSKDDAKDYIDFHQKKLTATTYIKFKKFKQAKETCAEMTSEHPNIAYTYSLLGDIAFNEHNLDYAIANYSYALRLDPKDHRSHTSLGLVLSNQRKFDEAVKHYKEAILLKPDFRQAHCELAIAYAHEGKLDDAIKHWKYALELKENDPKVHKDLADALAHVGKLDEAITHWKESLKFEPDNAKVHFDLAIALTQKGKIDEAISQCTESLRLDPHQPSVENSLARLLYAKGESREAIKHWKQAIGLYPDWPEVLNDLAWVMATHESGEFNNPSEALQYALKACELTEFRNPNLLSTLSVSYAAAGKFNEAVQTAEKALKLYKDSGLENKAEDLQTRIELFKKGQPYREKP